MEYNKGLSKKGRILSTVGPRDLQRRQGMQDDALIRALQNQIEHLETQIKTNSSQRGYSAEEVDEEINKAIYKVADELEKKYEDTLDNLKDKVKRMTDERNELYKTISRLEGLVEAKDDLIKTLKSGTAPAPTQPIVMPESSTDAIAKLLEKQTEKLEQIAAQASAGGSSNEVIIPADRPKMKRLFIDPLEDDAGKSLKSNIKTKKVVESEPLADKLEKLKKMGITLPQKKN